MTETAEMIFCAIVVLAIVVFAVLMLIDAGRKPKLYEEEGYVDHENKMNSIEHAIHMESIGTPTMSERDILKSIKETMSNTKYGCLSRTQHAYIINAAINMNARLEATESKLKDI